jgi:hypothetical protein
MCLEADTIPGDTIMHKLIGLVSNDEMLHLKD